MTTRRTTTTTMTTTVLHFCVASLDTERLFFCDVGWKASVFNWSDYLSHCNAEAAPADVFTAVSYFVTSCSACYCGVLVPNSTTRTPATDMLYNTTNGRAHNNSTTCCTTHLPPTDKNLPHPNGPHYVLGQHKPLPGPVLPASK